jgi:hypothetical protein
MANNYINSVSSKNIYDFSQLNRQQKTYNWQIKMTEAKARNQYLIYFC